MQITDTGFLLLVNNMSKILGEGNELDQGLIDEDNNIRQSLAEMVRIMSHFYE